MTTVTAPPYTERLLASWRSGQRADLDTHLAAHGPLALPMPYDRSDNEWPARTLGLIEASGLTGRGGGGFASWRKAETLRNAKGKSIVVVNAMEGEPASAKDRVLLTC